MRLFGWDVTRIATKSAAPSVSAMTTRAPADLEVDRAPSLLPISDRGSGGWFPLLSFVMEPFTGAWQRSQSVSRQNVAEFGAVFACITRIAQDISKMPVRLVEQDSTGIWREAYSAAFSPVLRKPNAWQNRIQFFEQWLVSKLTTGNTYALKERDARRIVTGLYVLNPHRVQPLVTPDGDVYYRIGRNDLAGLTDDTVVVPATEIIHDRINCLGHPLVGISPISACAAAASNGMNIQRNSSRFFENSSRPSGVLVTPQVLKQDQAEAMRSAWEANYGGSNTFKTAVLGGGMDYKAIAVNAVDSQLIEQLQWDERNICTAFHVPQYMIGVGEMPNPNIAPPGSEGAPDLEWNPYRKGHRIYNHHDRANNRWVWNMDFRPVKGEVFLDRGERAWGGGFGRGFIVVEPNIESWKSVAPNKQWPLDRYDAVVRALVRDGHKVLQFSYGQPQHVCPGAAVIRTPTFRHAMSVLANAKAYLGAEGGLHHAAAAFDVPGAVLFGGFIPPEVTGYPIHWNLTGGAGACGSLKACQHCREAMEAISVEEVVEAMNDVIKGNA